MKRRELLIGLSMIAPTEHTALTMGMPVTSVPGKTKRTAEAVDHAYLHVRIMRRNSVLFIQSLHMYATDAA